MCVSEKSLYEQYAFPPLARKLRKRTWERGWYARCGIENKVILSLLHLARIQTYPTTLLSLSSSLSLSAIVVLIVFSISSSNKLLLFSSGDVSVRFVDKRENVINLIAFGTLSRRNTGTGVQRGLLG